MVATVDNALSFMDQGSYLWVQASGHVHCIQSTWIYRCDIDLDVLRRTQDNLAHGLLARRVECSPLPFGRHRWVAWHEPAEIDVALPAASAADVGAWVEGRARVVIDPQAGLPWHIGVLPIDGYGTAVSLVVSHTVSDTIGICLALADAVNGVTHDFGYPPPGSRARWRALAEDARLAARGMSDVGRAIVVGAKLAGRTKQSSAVSVPLPSARRDLEGHRPAVVPVVRVQVDQNEWDSRAEALGGTPNTLFAGFAAKLGERIGRVGTDDGRVNLTYPVNDRVENDTRGNPLKSIDVTVDPAAATADLRTVRADIKQALTLGLGSFKEQEGVLPLIPLTPKWLVRRLAAVDATGAVSLPIGCAYLGDIDPAVACVAGTAADSFWMNLVAQNLTVDSPELRYGEMHCMAGRICGKMFVAVRCYQPGVPDWRRELAEHIRGTLADFDLTGVID